MVAGGPSPTISLAWLLAVGVRLTGEIDLHPCGLALCLISMGSTEDIEPTEFVSVWRGSVGTDISISRSHSLSAAALLAAAASCARPLKDCAWCEGKGGGREGVLEGAL